MNESAIQIPSSSVLETGRASPHAGTMPIIDAHVHLYPPEVNADPAGWASARGETHWATLCTRRRKSGLPVQAFPSLDHLLREMDTAGVARVVLLGWYWETEASCRMQNDFYADCVRAHPDRVTAFATLWPGAGAEAVRQQLIRARDGGLCGLGELSPHSQGYSINDEGFGAALECAQAWSWPINLHVTDPQARAYPGKVETPVEDFRRLALRHPKVNWILAHWGGGVPLADKRAWPENVYFDTAASPLLYPENVWKRFCEQVPPERVLFGSDFPLNLYPGIDPEPKMSRLLEEAHRSGLDPGALRAIMGATASRLLQGILEPK